MRHIPSILKSVLSVALTAFVIGCLRPETPIAGAKDPVSGNPVGKLISDMVDIPGQPYKACRYEATQALWEAVMGTNPSEFLGADRPVENVSWNDCQTFLEKLNATPEARASGLVFRLPTAEEWEHACRAGSTGDYCKLSDGTDITEDTLKRVAWYGVRSGHTTHSVGQKQPNAFGLYDMHGNVWEWTSTDIGRYRVNRGGGWWDDDADCCAWNYPSMCVPGVRCNFLGFRLFASAGQ